MCSNWRLDFGPTIRLPSHYREGPRAPMPPCARFFACMRGVLLACATCVRSCPVGTCAGAHLRREARVHGAWRGSSAVPIPGLVQPERAAPALPGSGLGSLVRLVRGSSPGFFVLVRVGRRLTSFRLLVSPGYFRGSILLLGHFPAGFRLRRVGPPFPTPSSARTGPAALASLMLVRQFFWV